MATIDAATPPRSTPPHMILVTFAVPQESRAFVARLRHAGMLGDVLVGNLGCEEIAVLHTGMGSTAARIAIEHALAEHRPTLVIGSGFAGGLDPTLKTGELIVGENFSTATPPAGIRRVRLIPTDAPLDTPAEKARLRATGADAVDLESAALAAACTAAQAPLLVLRIISDAADEALPLPSDVAFDSTRQRPRPLAILRHLFHHPEAIAPLAAFVRQLPMLQRRLADALVSAIEGSRD